MTVYAPPLADIGFVLRHVADLDGVARLPGYAAATPETVDAILTEAGRLAAGVLVALNEIGDREPWQLENGVVRSPAGFREAFDRYRDGGWMGLVFPEEYGGQGLPWLVNTAVSELWHASAMAFQILPLLTQGAIEALLHHGSPEQQALYIPKLVAGEWTAAMGLTEPQAGTDLGAVRTRAVPDGDGYRLFGQKIFNTFGDHDLADNIVCLALARLPDAPAGTRGLSLFLVPKYLPNPDGSLGPRNDVRCLKLEHKLGIRGSPTCVTSYGEDGGALGFLVGEQNGGIRCMFTMMNNARLAVGHEGLGVAERAWQAALAYAQDRVQGTWEGRPARLVDFPDVRRTLITMRAQIAAMRALAYWTASYVDRAQRDPDPQRRDHAADRVALLTPIVKAWSTDLAQEIASSALQCFGGMGYIEETGVAQHFRDARILSIYEGTNAIQGLDLAGRKLALKDGALPRTLMGELEAELPSLPADLRPALVNALAVLEKTTDHLRDRPEAGLVHGQAYVRLFGTTLGGFLLARGAAAAANDPTGASWPGLARFYLGQLLPPALSLAEIIRADLPPLDPDLLVA
ncbi:MAG: acyl-CoA dehydrogenase family protein [Geminicoccaceae bacterium]